MTPEEYASALDAIGADMRQLGINAECRGSGLARFIYAERGIRAVEVSALQPGASVEAFENGRNLSFPDPFETLDAAAAEAIAWLIEKG